EWNGAEAVGCESFELGPSLRERPELGQHVREDAAPDGVRRILGCRLADKRLYVVEAALFAAKHVELQSIGDLRIPALSPLSYGASLGNQLLGFRQASLQERQEGHVDGNEPSLRRLSELFRQSRHGLEVLLRRGHV